MRAQILRLLREEMARVPRRTVSWRPERVDSLIKNFGNPREGYLAATIAPDDFLAVTTDPAYIPHIRRELTPLDLDHLQDTRSELAIKKGIELAYDTPFLGVRNARAFGHEGRHRNSALGLAGARRVPIVLRPYYHSGEGTGLLSTSPRARIDGDDYALATRSAPLFDLTPITRDNRERLLALGTRKRTPDHITYLLPILAALLAQESERTEPRA